MRNTDTFTSLTYLAQTGLQGTPMPYRLSSDDGITAILLLCFFLTSYVLSKGKKFLLQQIKDFTHLKERSSLFHASTAADFRYKILLLLQTCILVAVYLFDYFHDRDPFVFTHLPSLPLLGTYIAVCIAYYFLKWQAYRLIGWIFFDKIKTNVWLESYSVILYSSGFIFFPVILLVVYFDLPTHISIITACCLVIFAKILMFYKWLKIFFNNIYSLFCLIVYFCALEILPCFILFQGIIQINNLLLIKF